MRARGIVAAAVLAVVFSWPTGASAAQRECALPQGANDPERVAPQEVGLDPERVQDAVAFATRRARINVQVFRNNCLVATGPYNERTDNRPWQLFSSTKSIVSMTAGVAYTQGKLDLDAPIGDYLKPGLGDEKHRSITVRQLLTQSSGLKQSIITEAIPRALLGGDRNVVAQGMSLPFVAEPGAEFQYSQRGPDLLAAAVQGAVGEPLQQFAQRELFEPLGIAATDYYWARDRSGNTYGYAFLFMPPANFSRFGLLLENRGVWNGRRIISDDYIDQATTSSATNACYGFLFWLNKAPCTGPSFPSRKTIDHAPLGGLPADGYAMVGFLHQNNFVVPSLNLVVTWNGVGGDISPDPGTLVSASINSELYHNFFRRLAPAFQDVSVPDPGPYKTTFNLDLDFGNFASPRILLGAYGIGPDAPPGCGPTVCNGEPVQPPFYDVPPGCFIFTCWPVSPETPRRRPPGASQADVAGVNKPVNAENLLDDVGGKIVIRGEDHYG